MILAALTFISAEVKDKSPLDRFSREQKEKLLKGDYTDKLRIIKYMDPDSVKRLSFITNNFQLPAITVAQLYRCRWQVELFFRWIKQHLRIKAFFVTSENAMITQSWIAISVYVLVAIMKKRLHLDASLYTILKILSVPLFEKKPILSALQPTLCKELQAAF